MWCYRKGSWGSGPTLLLAPDYTADLLCDLCQATQPLWACCFHLMEGGVEDRISKSSYIKACELGSSDVAFNPRNIKSCTPGHLHCKELDFIHVLWVRYMHCAWNGAWTVPRIKQVGLILPCHCFLHIPEKPGSQAKSRLVCFVFPNPVLSEHKHAHLFAYCLWLP